MQMKNPIRRLYLSLTFFIISYFIFLITQPGFINNGLLQYIQFIASYISLYLIVRLINFRNYKFKYLIITDKLILMYLIYQVINGFISVFINNSFPDIRYLFFSALPFTLLCLFYFIGKHIIYYNIINTYVLKIFFLIGLLILLIPNIDGSWNDELYSRLMVPVTFLIIFIPYFSKINNLVIFSVSILSIIYHLPFRTNIIRIAYSYFLLISYYFFNTKIFNLISKITYFVLIIIPISYILFYFIFGFNLFNEFNKLGEYEVQKSNGYENLTADSRTFLYKEVFLNFRDNSSMFFGKGLNGSYNSIAFKYGEGFVSGKRYNVEIGFLNQYVHNGLIGLFLLIILILQVSYLAIFRSSNKFSKMLGLFLIFRYVYGFVEEMNNFDLNFLYFWLSVGLASSQKLRNFTDEQLHKIIRIN